MSPVIPDGPRRGPIRNLEVVCEYVARDSGFALTRVPE
jgi:hypothetical protein